MSSKDTPATTVQEGTELSPTLQQFATQFDGVLSTLTAFRSQITMLQNQIRGLEKNVKKLDFATFIHTNIHTLCSNNNLGYRLLFLFFFHLSQ